MLMHSSPFTALSASTPISLSISRAISLLISLSSTRSTRQPLRERQFSFFSSCFSSSKPFLNSRTTVTTVPFPCWLSTVMVPPIVSTRRFVIDIPRPVPVTPLKVALRSLEKELKMYGRNSSDIPMPLSETVKVNLDFSLSISSSFTVSFTFPPSGVYLMAFPITLRRIFWTLTLSQRIVEWQALPSARNSIPFSSASLVTLAMISPIMFPHSTGFSDNVSLPLSILAISNTSPIRPKS